MKRAQTEVFTLLLISGIVIGLVGTAYFWGKPLIEKRTAANDFSMIQRFADDIDAAIITMANSKSGAQKLRIPNGRLSVIPYDAANPNSNTIILEFPLAQKLILGDASIFYKTTSTGSTGLFGSDQPRIISFSQTPQGTGYVFRMTIHYRELLVDTPPKRGFLIALVGPAASAGITELSLSYNGVDTSVASNGGPLVFTRISASAV